MTNAADDTGLMGKTFASIGAFFAPSRTAPFDATAMADAYIAVGAELALAQRPDFDGELAHHSHE